jgi:putative transcriptional regulator
MSKLGRRLIGAAKEARRIARGEADPTTYRIHVPAMIDVAEIRRELKMSQAEFAIQFGFSVATIRDYEQDRTQPNEAIRAYLMVIAKQPKAVKKALKAA